MRRAGVLLQYAADGFTWRVGVGGVDGEQFQYGVARGGEVSWVDGQLAVDVGECATTIDTETKLATVG